MNTNKQLILKKTTLLYRINKDYSVVEIYKLRIKKKKMITNSNFLRKFKRFQKLNIKKNMNKNLSTEIKNLSENGNRANSLIKF